MSLSGPQMYVNRSGQPYSQMGQEVKKPGLLDRLFECIFAVILRWLRKKPEAKAEKSIKAEPVQVKSGDSKPDTAYQRTLRNFEENQKALAAKAKPVGDGDYEAIKGKYVKDGLDLSYVGGQCGFLYWDTDNTIAFYSISPQVYDKLVLLPKPKNCLIL